MLHTRLHSYALLADVNEKQQRALQQQYSSERVQEATRQEQAVRKLQHELKDARDSHDGAAAEVQRSRASNGAPSSVPLPVPVPVPVPFPFLSARVRANVDNNIRIRVETEEAHGASS